MSSILIVEDEIDIAELERDYLKLAGFEVSLCADGDEGLRKALTGDFDLLILDIMLPGTGGFEICRKVRETMDTPVLMVSARRDDMDKIRGLGLGADDYITKPFSPSELVARVKAHLSRYSRLTGGGKNEILEIRGLRIDHVSRKVWVNGKEKIFTAREFELLYFLASHPNRVYSKEELFKEIWGLDSVGDIATVTVHIRKIREKLDDPSLRSGYIETIWGVGYRFRL